jgi:hypothetical protein
MGGERAGYATVSIPTAIADEIDRLIDYYTILICGSVNQ